MNRACQDVSTGFFPLPFFIGVVFVVFLAIRSLYQFCRFACLSLPAAQNHIAVFRLPFNSITAPLQSLCCDDLRTATGKWFIAKLALFGMLADGDCKNLDRFGGRVFRRLERRALDNPCGRW